MGAIGAIGAMAGGGLLSAAGSIAAGQANSNLAKYNAQVSELMAADALKRGKEAESRHRADVRGLIGSQRAGYAGQGIDANDGSALDVQADTAAQGELDALQIRHNAAMEAWGHRAQASESRYRGKIARVQGFTGAAGTLLNTGAESYRTYKLLKG